MRTSVAPLWVGTVTVYSVLWVQCPVLFSQPYVPKKPPVLRVTEGPFFSEVAAYYEHFHQVIRLYNLPGEPEEMSVPQAGTHSSSAPFPLTNRFDVGC